MAGVYLNKVSVRTCFQKWSSAILSSQGKWEGNNLHIDEIDGLKEISRAEWVRVSFGILDIIDFSNELMDSMRLFLHFDLEYSSARLKLDTLSTKWLEENVSAFTPPSLHFTSHDYYRDFYSKELVLCKPDSSIQSDLISFIDFDFFYRSYFDENEKMYSREIYVFYKNIGF